MTLFFGHSMRRLALLVLLIATAASAQPKPGTSTMELDSAHAMVTVTAAGAKGRFETVAGALQYDPAKPDASTVLLSLDAGSIQNAALRAALDAERFPEMRIASTAVIKAGAMPVAVTVRDITRPVIFQISFKTTSKDVIALHAQALLKSADFHLPGGDIAFVIDAPFDKVQPTKPLP
jgi:polyisoprenoid-binding protein YceI